MNSIWILNRIEYIEYCNHPEVQTLGRFAKKPTFKTVKEKLEDCDCDELVEAIFKGDEIEMTKYIGHNLKYRLFRYGLDESS